MNPNPQTPDELAKAVRGALESLKQHRPIFHSECDLQLALFRTMMHSGAFSRVVMEHPFPSLLRGNSPQGKRSVDIYADGVVLELKEKSRECVVKWKGELLKGELFTLRGKSSFTSNVKKSQRDIERVACVVGNESDVKIGFVVILTSRTFHDAENSLLANLDLPDNCVCQFKKEDVWSEIPLENGRKYVTKYFVVEIRKKP